MTKKIKCLYAFTGVTTICTIAIKLASSSNEVALLLATLLISWFFIVREFLSTECRVVDQVDENAEEPKETLPTSPTSPVMINGSDSDWKDVITNVEDNKDSK